MASRMATPRRILMTADAVGGVWTYALDLARELSSRNIDIHLGTLGPPPSPWQREEVERIPRVALHVGHFRLEWMEDPWEDVERSGEWLLSLEREIQPDIVHLNGYSHGNLPWSVPTVVVGHSCVLSWWRAVHGTDAPPSWNRYRAAVRAGLTAATVVVAPSRAMLTSLQRYYAIGGGFVVPNGRPAPRPGPASLPREELILGVGRLWDEAKNLASLARVASRIDWPVALAGDVSLPGSGGGGPKDSPNSNAPRPAADSPDPEGSFEGATLLGRLPADALASWYSRASIVALPARYEPFGLSALEAGLAGCALVLGDIPSLREVWGESAVFVPPGDDDALERTLQDLIRDRERRIDMAHRARERALGFTVERMADGTLDVYRSALMQRSARCGS